PFAGHPNGACPTASLSVPPAARHQPSRLEPDPPQRPHCPREPASVACGRPHTEQVKQRNSTYARHIGGRLRQLGKSSQPIETIGPILHPFGKYSREINVAPRTHTPPHKVSLL